MKRALCLLTAAGALLAAPIASAQLLDPTLNLQRFKTGEPSLPSRISFFSTFDYSTTSFDGKFDTKQTATIGTDTSTAQYTYKASGMDTRVLQPSVGVGYAVSPQFLLTVAVGPSFIKLKERLYPSPKFYQNDHADAFQYDLSPGFAATLGGSYQLYAASHVGVTVGGRLGYQSSGHLQNDQVDGTTSTGGNVQSFQEQVTHDVSVNILQLVLHAGVEWKPFRTYVSNHFGVLAGGGYGFGSMDQSTRSIQTTSSGSTGSSTAHTIDISLVSSRFVGVYYGWSVFIPRFGVLGVEARFVTSTSVLGSYEYLF